MSLRRSARLRSTAKVDTPPTIPKSEPGPHIISRKRKTQVEDTGPSPSEPDRAASTPRKRQIRKFDPRSPATPTVQEGGIISEGALQNGAPGTPKRPQPAAVTRLADPNKTNATLLSPKTSRVIASKPVNALSPSKHSFNSGLSNSGNNDRKITTATLLEEACAHLIKVDERMKPLIEKHRCHIFSPEGLAETIDPFEAISSSIISQQVSGAAAKAIKARFIALFERGNGENRATHDGIEGQEFELTSLRRFPHPSQVAAMPIEKLRTAGLSQRKAEYLSGLAEKFASGELSAQMLADAPYEEILEKLIAVRGLGRWSVEMFACFALKRMDVFSLGDLGVQRGMAAFVGRDVSKLKAKGGKWKYMSEREMEEISDRFRPYRSLFMWYMWRVEETDVSTLE